MPRVGSGNSNLPLPWFCLAFTSKISLHLDASLEGHRVSWVMKSGKAGSLGRNLWRPLKILVLKPIAPERSLGRPNLKPCTRPTFVSSEVWVGTGADRSFSAGRDVPRELLDFCRIGFSARRLWIIRQSSLLVRSGQLPACDLLAKKAFFGSRGPAKVEGVFHRNQPVQIGFR